MPSRRQFIQAGLAMSVAPVSIQIQESVTGPAPLAKPVPNPLYCIVCDTRSSWSIDLAREAERLGIRVVRTTGDITDFWFNDLSRRWKTAPVAIGGLTEHGPLFCLERFGWDHGLRVVFRGTHRALDTGRVEHAIAGPFSTIAAAHTGLAGGDWPGRLARLLSSCPAVLEASSTTVQGVLADDQRRDVHRPAATFARCASPPKEAGHSGHALASWVIAPKPASVPPSAIDGRS